MPDEPPSRPKPDAARFFVFTDAAAAQWPPAVQTALKNPTPFIVKSVEGLAKGWETIDQSLKSAGAVDEVILWFGIAEAKTEAWKAGGELTGVSRLLEKLAYRVQMYQPQGREPPQITLCTPTPIGTKAGKDFDGANDRLAELAKVEREAALFIGTRYVDLFAAMKPQVEKLLNDDGISLNAAGQQRVAELVSAIFADRPAPQQPADVKIAGQKVTWTASPTKEVIGYEIHDLDDDSTLLTTSVTTEATLPEGHDTCAVIARDAAGRVSEGAKPDN